MDDIVSEQVPAIETQRVLLGFLDEEEAVQRLEQANQIRNPIDTDRDEDELQAEKEARMERHRERWEEAKESLKPPEQWDSDSVSLLELPDTEEVADHLDEYTDKPQFQEAVANVPQWEFKRVPLKSLVAFQPQITTTAYQDIPSWDEDPLNVLEYCFPVDSRELRQQVGYNSEDGSMAGVKIVSRGPNISLKTIDAHAGEHGSTIVNVEVASDPNFVQVVEFQGRYILKNGYHRAYQLLTNGETHIPAVVVSGVTTYEDTGGAKNGFFTKGMVCGQRPPLLSDFTTDTAVELEQPATNTVVDITAKQTQVTR